MKLAPLVRSAISHLSQKDAAICLGGLFFTFSFLPYVPHNDPFSIANGNHCLWLLILYALGAYTRKFDPFAKYSVKKLLLLFFGACLIQVSTLFVVPSLSHLLNGKSVSQWYFINNDSPTTLCLAQLPSILPVIAVLVCAILIYLVCICIDAIREYVFRIFRINQFLSAAEKRILSLFQDDAA